MKKALIEHDNLVSQVEEQEFDVAPPLYWVDCGDEIEAKRYRYENGTFVKISDPPWNAESLREVRNALLKESDLVVIADKWMSMTPERQNEWAVYRQALRDIPNQNGFPLNVIWPNRPAPKSKT